MKRAIVIAAAAALVGTPCWAASTCSKSKDDADLTTAQKAAVTCVGGHFRALELSGETPQTIAQAAVSECDREFRKAWDVAARCFHSFWNPLLGEELATDVDSSFRATVRHRVVASVTEIRARRAAPAPAPPVSAPPPAAISPEPPTQ